MRTPRLDPCVSRGLRPCQTVQELTPGEWTDGLTPENMVCAYAPEQCDLRYHQNANAGLCNALLDGANVKRVVYLGDSTAANVFLSTIYHVLPRATAADTPVLSC